jgi:hypothetical protein
MEWGTLVERQKNRGACSAPGGEVDAAAKNGAGDSIVRKTGLNYATVPVEGSKEAGSKELTMKKMTLAMVLLIGAPMAVCADVSKEEVKKLCAAGISNDVILSYVRSNGPVAKLSADDLLELKQAGANNALLAALLTGPTRATTPSPVYAPPVVPSDTYVPAPSSPVYSTIPSYGPSDIYDDYYPSVYYSGGYSAYCGPSLGLGFGYCGGFYGNRFRGFYGNSRFVRSFPGSGISRFAGGSFGHGQSVSSIGGGHSGFGGGHFGGGGAHGGGGGHGGHR